MPSDETRRLLKTFGVAVTTYEDAVVGDAAMEAILEAEADARARLEEITALINHLEMLRRSRPGA